MRSPFVLILALGLLNALTPFSIDLYLPAFDAIARDLGVAVQRLSLSVSVYFIGFALGQLFYGPLLDRFGRKPPIYLGLAVYLLATVGCMTAKSFEMLLLFRFISALGGSAASVGAITMARDYFPIEEAPKVFSMLMLVLSVSPLLAPTLGGLLVGALGWRSLFSGLLMLGLVDFALVAWVLPRVYVPDETVSLKLKPIVQNFRMIMSHPRFWVYTLAGSFSFAGLFVYVAGSPGIFMDTFKISPQFFGAIFAGLTGGMIGGGQLNRALLKRFSITSVFHTTLIFQTVVCVVFFFLSYRGESGIEVTLILLFLILLCAGITYPNAATLALEPFSRNIGSASALLGFWQLGIGAVMAALLGLVSARGTLPMAVAMLFSAVVGCLILGVGQKSLKPKPSI